MVFHSRVILAARELAQTIVEAEMDLTLAKSQGYMRLNQSSYGKKFLAVIGVYTGFGRRLNRNTFRGSWMPRGDALNKLEERHCHTICNWSEFLYVFGNLGIGSPNRGDSLDRIIDEENRRTNDFLILEGHEEATDELPKKAKIFFSSAIETWDAEFYVKADDSINLDLGVLEGRLIEILQSHHGQTSAYVGCMKSGAVVNEFAPSPSHSQSQIWLCSPSQFAPSPSQSQFGISSLLPSAQRSVGLGACPSASPIVPSRRAFSTRVVVAVRVVFNHGVFVGIFVIFTGVFGIFLVFAGVFGVFGIFVIFHPFQIFRRLQSFRHLFRLRWHLPHLRFESSLTDQEHFLAFNPWSSTVEQEAVAKRYNPRWNTICTAEGETAIDLWAFHCISGLPIVGEPYEEVVLDDFHRDSTDGQGHYVLEFCYRYLLRVWHDLAKARHSASSADGTGDGSTSSTDRRVSLYTWVRYFYGGPFCYVNEFAQARGERHEMYEISREELSVSPHIFESPHQTENPWKLDEITHLAAYLAYWLCTFAMPFGDESLLRPE
ncbi:hypothetical protein Taro_001746, partial [Colocasia esculenta]|nr:hypothetical protein [Colocasia esculenta]